MNRFPSLFYVLCFLFLTFSCSKAGDAYLIDKGSNPKKENNLYLGNPSNAKSLISDSLNFLMEKSQFAISYNSSKGIPNWVSWHLNKEWLGEVVRQDNFRSDPDLPSEFYKVRYDDYQNSGFDRGHMCPSADRTRDLDDNSSTFLMSNMIPQAPNLNRFPWKNFEEYCRSMVDRGYELYIISGGLGNGGIGSNESFNTNLPNTRIQVPAYCWKVALILKEGDKDLSRIDSNTMIIACLMPNVNNLNKTWTEYLYSTRYIEQLTGYDFFSNVPKHIQDYIEPKKNQPF